MARSRAASRSEVCPSPIGTQNDGTPRKTEPARLDVIAHRRNALLSVKAKPAKAAWELRILICAVRPEGADYQWRKVPPGELSIDPVADKRLGRVTGRAGASSQRPLLAVERSDAP